MKSLIAVLALASALGVGYWKMQNPDGGIDEAKSQAQGLIGRLGAGIDAIRSGSGGNAAATAAAVQADALDSRIAALEASLTSEQSSIADRLSALENAPTPQNAGVVADENMSERLTSIDETLATAASLASDTESRMVLLEETVAAMDRAKTEANTDTAVTTQLEEQLSALQAKLDAQSAESAAQIDALENQLIELSAAAEKDLETQLSGIRTETETIAGAIDEKLTGQLDRQTTTEKNIGLLEEKIATLTTRINTLGSASVSASNTDDNSESDENNANGANALALVTAQVDQRLAAIEDRINTATSTNTRASIGTLESKLDEANQRIQSLESELAAMASSSDSKLTSSLTAVTGDVESVEAEMGTLKNSYEQVQADVETLQSGLTDLKSTVESYAIEDLQNDIQTKLTNLENQVKNSPANDIASITSAIEQSRDRINTLEQRVTELPASSDESQNAKRVQTALEKQIAALETRLTAAGPASDEQLSSTLSSVQKEVDALKNRKYLTAEDLQRSTSGKSIEYKIYFDKSQIAISDEAAKVLDSFIAQESNRATSISIFGTTDRSGSDEYNQQLAKRRANRVRSYLIQRGYDFTKIGMVDGIGEDLAAAELPDGQEDANQRSVIIYAYQP